MEVQPSQDDSLSRHASTANPLVSIVVPAWNAERFLAQTLSSIENQTYTHFEAIIVDDASTDSTCEIASQFQRRDQRFRVIHKDVNEGVASARNSAIEKCNGDLISPIDADDIWHPQKLEHQIDQFDMNDAELGMTYTGIVRIDEQNKLIDSPNYPVISGWVYDDLFSRNVTGGASTSLIRKDALPSPPYDSSLQNRGAQGCEDWKLYLEISRHYKIKAVPRRLVAYRTAQNSMSDDVFRMMKSRELVMDDLVEKGWLSRRQKNQSMARRHLGNAMLPPKRRGNNRSVATSLRHRLLHLIAGLKYDPFAVFSRSSWCSLIRSAYVIANKTRNSGSPGSLLTELGHDWQWLSHEQTSNASLR